MVELKNDLTWMKLFGALKLRDQVVVKIPGKRKLLGIANFALEDDELKLYLDNDGSVFVVPKAYMEI